MDTDPDPVRATYDVFVKPRTFADRQVYILQFPNRDPKQNYNAAAGAQPLTMRVKPNARMVELDVPMDTFNNYDKEKGVKWGEAIKRSILSKGGGSHGLPGGFGIGGAPATGRGRGRGNAENDEFKHSDMIMADWETAVQREQVLVKQTLGGQAVPNEDTNPQYMIGTFRKDQLHLTPVDNIIQMRPQFHHIDALAEQERISRRDPAIAGRLQEARAVHMTVRSHIDGEDGSSSEKPMAERIAAAQGEPWKSHKYIDEDEEESWRAYSESMFVCANIETTNEILAHVPKLTSALDNNEYLDAVSRPRDAARLVKMKTEKGKVANGKQEAKDSAEEPSTSSESEFEEESPV